MTRLWPVAASLACVVVLTAQPRHACANGRQPNTTGIVVDPSNPNRMLAGLTFGVMVSTDAGLNWRWVCEEVLGGSSAVDAQVAITAAGTLLVANPNGLYESTDDGCAWTKVGAIAAPLQTTWLGLHPTDANRWLVAVNDPNQAGGLIYQTADAGAHFDPMPQPQARLYLYSVAFAPSQPTHIYAAGSNNASSNSAYLVHSADGGTTWQSTVITGAPAASAEPRLGVSPTNPNVVLVAAQDVRTSGTTLLRTTDGGTTFTVVFTMSQAVRSIAYTPDGSQVFVASLSRIAHSADGGATFELLAAPMYNACVAQDGDTIYACGNEASGDAFTLGRSSDEGATFETLMDLSQIHGPFACAAATDTNSVCLSLWPDEAASIGAPVQPVMRLPSATSPTGQTSGSKSEGGCHCQNAAVTAPVWLLALLFGLRRHKR